MPQNRAEAERWYCKAADQGDEYAQRALGLRGSGLSIFGIFALSAMFLWCLLTLKDSLLPQRNFRDRQLIALTIGAIGGLAYIGLSLYGAFGVFQSLLSANAFHFVKSLIAGISIAMLISVLGAKSVKITLGISSVLLIGNDLIVISRHELTRFITTIRGFSSINGLLMGMAVTLAIFLWLQTTNTADKGAAG